MLQLEGEQEAADGHVVDGSLTCRTCAATFIIQGGVPRLADIPLTLSEHRTQERFGYEWRWYRATGPEFVTEFWDYLEPLTASHLRGRIVLDAGCGNGRFALAASMAARVVLAVDFSDSVEVAFAAARHLPNVHVIQGNVLALPVKTVDVVYSIGVLHHLQDPAAGFAGLVDCLAPGGTIAIWVYSREGNSWLLTLIEPVRWITGRLPPVLVKTLALPGAAALWGASLVARAPFGRRRRIPLGDYLRFQGQFGFGYLWLTVFDKLVAPTVSYIPRGEVERWLAHPDLRDPLVLRNDTGWRATATRAARQKS